MAEYLPLNEAERDSDRSWYSSFASGIASGLIKVPEGVFSLTAELIDLGFFQILQQMLNHFSIK